MIARLLSVELALLWRERHVRWTLVALAVVMLAAFASGAIQQSLDGSRTQDLAAAERTRWLAQGEKDPHSAAHYSIHATRRPAPLAALDAGVGAYLGQTVWLEAHQQNDTLYRPLGDAAPLHRRGAANPATLLIALGPLAAFVLAYASLAASRDRGTLRLSLGAASSPLRIVIPKALAILVALLLALLLPAVAIDTGLAFVQQRASVDLLLRLSAWTAVFAAYLAVMAAIGVAVAVRIGHARTALSVLVALWVVLALALPRGSSTQVETGHPLPSSQQVRQQLLDEAPSYWSAETGLARQAALLATYKVARVEDLPFNVRGAELDQAERHSHVVFDRVLGDMHDRAIAQDTAFARHGWLSPATAALSLSQVLAGSDFAHHRRFIDDAERYRRALVNRMNHEVRNHKVAPGERVTADARLWSQIPAFVPAQVSLGSAWGPARPALLALLAWLVAAVGALAFAARGMRP